MTAIILCFSVGVVLLAFEVILPGAVCGIIGTLCMLAGVGFAFSTLGTMGGAVATLVAVVVLGVALYLEFVWLPKSGFVQRLWKSDDKVTTSQPALARAEEVVGQEAVAQTVLGPSGYVLVGGRRYEAFSQSGLVNPGELLRVIGLDNFRLIVTKL